MTRRSAITDDQIVARARAVFVERGYTAPTKQIAAVVGLTWGAIALRFGSKQALFSQAMAEPVQLSGDADCGQAVAMAKAGQVDLAEQLQRLRDHLWRRWPQRLQYRVAAVAAPARGLDVEESALVSRLAAALAAHAGRGAVRSDIGAETLARVVLALLTGDVVRRFVAHDATLPPDPAFIDGIVRLLSPV